MALIKITFDSASVTSKQDADCNHFLANSQNGKILGLGSGVNVSTSNNYIYLSSGYVQVYGRRVYVEANTRIAVALDSSAYGYIFISFNLGNNTVSLSKRESSGNYPILTQEDLSNGGLLYELPVARYTKTTSSLILDPNYTAPQIKSADALAASRDVNQKAVMEDYYKCSFQRVSTTKSGNTYCFSLINSSTSNHGIGNVYVAGWNVIFSTDVCSGSGGVYQYKVNDTWYNVSIQLTSAGLYVTPASSSHIVNNVYVTR
jgi:hypothetical protein